MPWRNYNKANRGQELEDMINRTNERYDFLKEANIQKIPTPVKVLDLNQKTGKIRSGFYEAKSTVDYKGTAAGKSISFEAKQTNIKTRFDLSNISDHQYDDLEKTDQQNGVAFVIVRFTKLDENYYLPFEELKHWIFDKERKSIPYDAFEHRIRPDGLKEIDYLSTMKELEG